VVNRLKIAIVKNQREITLRLSKKIGLMISIQTSRLTLRDFSQNDWLPVHSYASDPEVVRYMDWGPNSEEETKCFIKRAIAYRQEQPRRNYDLAIVLEAEDKTIGGCGFHVSSPDNKEGWIGYVLHRDYWGKGYATETAGALLAFGFEQHKLHRIFATCFPANAASAHVMEKIGMKREGRFREHRWVKNGWRDSYFYAILDYEWKALKQKK
jgi:RimJ/RimL family protein N-acetyltransferase